MIRYAQSSNGVVVNVIESANAPDPSWLACGDAGPGYRYDGSVFAAPAVPVDHCIWLIDIGPFYDRFGAAKMAVLTSTDATIKALLADVNVRKWVDLQRADVIGALTYIGSIVPALTVAMQTTILTTPASAEENRVLRRMYF